MAAIKLVPKKEQFDGPGHELYMKLDKLIDSIEGLSCLDVVAVLDYTSHAWMHYAMDAESEDDE